jgi:hypothetical protein
MNTTIFRRVLLALLTALAIAAGVVPQAAALHTATQETAVQIAGSRGDAAFGRESS